MPGYDITTEISLNKYKNPKMILNYAKPDAESFGKPMVDEGKLFKSIELHSLFDEDASQVNIFEKIGRVGSENSP